MIKKALIGFGIVLIAFLAFVLTRESRFHYERSGLINASPEEIYPYISDFRRGNEWSPFAQADPNMKVSFSGPIADVGSKMEWEGNSEAGAGQLEILRVVPNELVEIQLTMLKPIHAVNLIQYQLTPEPTGGTTFSWSMSGDAGFIGQLMNIFIDCEEMVAGQFTVGIQNLKNLIENKKNQ